MLESRSYVNDFNVFSWKDHLSEVVLKHQVIESQLTFVVLTHALSLTILLIGLIE